MADRNGLTDIHHHIIYGVDDGAENSDVSKEMLRIAAEQDVRRIICSSHIDPGRDEWDLGEYTAHLESLRGAALSLGIELLPGAEVFYSEKTIEYLREGRVQLISPKHVLIEFDPQIPRQFLLQAIRKIGDLGLIPVVAHVERYSDIHGSLPELRKENAVLQMNAHTVLEAFQLFPDRWARAALKEGMIDVIASDAHDTRNRICRLGDAYDILRKKLGEQTADRMCRTVPDSILNGSVIRNGK